MDAQCTEGGTPFEGREGGNRDGNGVQGGDGDETGTGRTRERGWRLEDEHNMGTGAAAETETVAAAETVTVTVTRIETEGRGGVRGDTTLESATSGKKKSRRPYTAISHSGSSL